MYFRYTASIMASEADFLKDMQPPDIEEVKVVSSSNNDNITNPSVLRHYAEKLDEDTIRSAINNLFLQMQQKSYQVYRKPLILYNAAYSYYVYTLYDQQQNIDV